MRRRRVQDDTEHALNLTPTIDVVFLLLIFFIATIRLPKPEANIRAYLPRKDTVASAAKTEVESEKAETTDRIEIRLRALPNGQGELRLNGAVLKGFRDLDRRLAGLARVAAMAASAQTEVILDAGRKVPYHYVVTALDLCSKHKLETVSFAMPPKGASGAP